MSWRGIARELDVPKSTVHDYLSVAMVGSESNSRTKTPKILLLDVETAPVFGAVWSLWKQNVGLNQIKTDWFLLSYSAKWLGSPPDEILYEDLRGTVRDEDDTKLLHSLWTLLDGADILITQNGKRFDAKKINARLILNGFSPPSSYKHIDTLEIAKANFAFTSNKLEYMTDKLCTEYKKVKHSKFAGFELWKQCLADNVEAWEEMEEYNKYDVLSLEELYYKLAPWDKRHPNLNLYDDTESHTCRCGSTDIIKYGYHYTQLSKFQRYKCKSCGAETRDRVNLLTKEKRNSLHMNVI
jgi:hypothetical protein